jgi:hypothetical protein
MKERPVGVTVIAILAILAGLGYLVGALALFGVSKTLLTSLQLGGLGGTTGLTAATLLVVMGALDIVFGVGALMLKQWAWWMGVVLFGVALAANLTLMFSAQFTATTLVMGVIAAAILGYMLTDNARAAFGYERGYYGERHGGGPAVHT